jgi:hypothetical protein
VLTKILHKPVAIAHHVVGGVARTGLHGAVAVVRKILPDPQETRTDHASPTISTEPVRQPPSPTTTTKKATTNTMPAKKARAKRAAAKKSTPKATAAKKSTPKKPAAKKSTPKKPAATLDEGPAPVDDDPVVYSTGPDVAANVQKDDLDDRRP